MCYGIWYVHRIKPNEKYACFSMKEIWRNLEGLSKYKVLWSYVVRFEFSRPKIYKNKTTPFFLSVK